MVKSSELMLSTDYKDRFSEKEFFDTLHEIYTEKWECLQN